MDAPSRTGPLAGYRILEFATIIAAPMAAMLLGDQGADVIKVEPPQGDNLRRSGAARSGVDLMGSIFMNVNRNKRSICLDLKNAAHLDAARRMAAQCDVVLQNYRPSVATRLGIGYDDLRALREDIIYVSVSGLGDEGPLADRRVYDIVIQGMAGFVSVQSDPATGEPRAILQTIVDKITALTIWQAVTAALLHRERTGEGQHVKINMLQAGLAFLWPDAMGNITLEGEGVRPGATMADISRAFPTADGRLMAGYVSDDEWQALCRALGRQDLANDDRFHTIELRTVNTTVLNEALADAFRQRTTASWLEALEREGAIYAPINTPADVANSPQICEVGGIHRHEHPVAGLYVQPGHPINFGATPHLAHRHAPQLGADGADILQEFGIAPLPDRIGSAKS